MKIAFAEFSLPTSGTLVLGVWQDRKLTEAAATVDQTLGGALARTIASGPFTGKAKQTLLLPALGGFDRILLLGIGEQAKLTLQMSEDLGGTVYTALAHSGATEAACVVGAGPTNAAHGGYGARLASYRFDKYFTKKKPEDLPTLKAITFLCNDAPAAETAFGPLDKVADGVFLARDLVSEPPNILYPETLAARAADLANLGLEVKVLEPEEMATLGMGALLGVAQGSVKGGRLVTMHWKGGDGAPLALIGKGVTFDTGGISIKPAAGMEDMKWDMGGSAAVIGAMCAIAGRKAKANVVGLVGLVENMPDGNAQRPGDVVTTMSGQTVEVINTDAEGRLVLCDVMTYAQKTFAPKAMVELSTLTGAIIVSLGFVHAGLFSNNDALSASLTKAGEATGETLWRMPLGDEYDQAIKSDIADMKNVGPREGGSISAAQFLQRFVENDTPWAHLDIAGKAWGKTAKPTVPKGGVGFGVRLLDRLVADSETA
jgi:leucyl aminopeptidase